MEPSATDKYYSGDYGIPPVVDYGSRWGGGLFSIGNQHAISELELSTLSTCNSGDYGISPFKRSWIEMGFSF